MTRYTLTVPLQLNDGTPTPEHELRRVEDDLLDWFGGYTATDGVGGWRSGAALRTYREPVRIFAVDTDDEDAERYVLSVARAVAKRLDQEAVYVTAAPIQNEFITVGVPA